MVNTIEEESSRRATQAREESIELPAVIRTMPQPLLILDGSLSVLHANGPFCETFKVDPGETEGQKLSDLGNGQWNIPGLTALLEDTLENGRDLREFRVEHEFPEVGFRVMALNACRLEADGAESRILVAIEDITLQERALWQLEAQKEYAEKIVDASRDALLILGWDLKVKAANETFYESFQVDPAETEGRMVYELGNGQWNIPKLRELLENVLPENNAFDDFEVEHDFEDLGRRIMVLNARRIDHLQLILLAIEDQTEKRGTAARLRMSAERLRRAVEVGNLGLWDWDLRSGGFHWSDETYPMMGYAVGEVEPSYEVWAARLHPDDRAEAEARVRDTMQSSGGYEHEYRVVHPDGSTRWLHARGRFFSDEAGEPLRTLGAMIDTTERREMEERNKVLISELQHRTMNLLAVVQSLVRKTMRGSSDIAEFHDRFDARLHSLARVQMLLSRLDENDRVAFDDVLDAELRAVGARSEQLTLDGPSGVSLRSSSVQTFAMALHELATNAVKYGALAQPSGHLTVTWRYEPPEPGGEPLLHVDWRESGVVMPRDAATPSGTGQGRELIERALPHQLNADISYELGPDGVHCTISMPVSKRTARE